MLFPLSSVYDFFSQETVQGVGLLGIRDILLRIRIPESVPLNNGSGSGSGSNYGSDSFVQWLQDAKKIFFHIFIFLITYPQALSCLKNLIFCKNLLLKFFLIIGKKREGSWAVPLTCGSGSERPKNIRFRIRISSGSNTGLHCFSWNLFPPL